MKTNDNQINHPLTPPFPMRRRSFWPMILMAAAFMAFMVSTRALSTDTITFYVDTTWSDSAPLSPYLEADRMDDNATSISNYNPGGWYWTATNTQLVTIYTNAGIRFFSLGGGTSSKGIPTTNAINNFFSFAQAANLQVNWVLGIPDSDKAPSILSWTNQEATNAEYMMQNFSNNVLFLSIGNEKDGGGTAFHQYTNFSETMWPAWRTYYTDITNFLKANNTPLPAWGGLDAVIGDNTWSQFWVTTNKNLGYPIDAVDMSDHWQPIYESKTNDMYADAIHMLDASIDTSYDTESGYIVNYDNVDGSITEFNALNYGNGQGTNDTHNGYANALFALDALHWWGQEGLYTLNFLDTRPDLYYDDYEGTGNYEGSPLMYGCAAYNESGGADAYYGAMPGGNPNNGFAAPLTGLDNPSGVNCAVYAVEDFDSSHNVTNLYVTIINKTMSTWATDVVLTFTNNMPYPGKTKIHRMVLEQGNGDNYMTATNGVTLGNADLNGYSSFQPQWENMGIMQSAGYKVTVTNGSAQILQFSDVNN